MRDFTDTDVRNAVGFIPKTTTEMRFSEDEAAKFDRWMAGVKAEAWSEGHAQALANIAWPDERAGNPYEEAGSHE